MIKLMTGLLLSLISLSCLSATAQPPPQFELKDELQVAYFAGGCFWCVEADFEKYPGIIAAISGFSGGDEVNPTYRQVASGQTEHVETVQVRFDPQIISYEDLLQIFWRQIDPTDSAGQFVDRGAQYRPVIFYHLAEQQLIAQQSKKKLAESNRYTQPLTVEILPFKQFYSAADKHQDYYKTHPLKYKYYRYRSGRDQYLKQIWGNQLDYQIGSIHSTYQRPSDALIQQTLTPLQYKVTQHEATEPPFDNRYWDNKQVGIYVDIVSGEPLFSSRDKYRSGTGWPTFSNVISEQFILLKEDNRLFYTRIELRSRIANSHLGHLFDDGPAPTGKRYCINSAALRFIPQQAMVQQGYGRYLSEL